MRIVLFDLGGILIQIILAGINVTVVFWGIAIVILLHFYQFLCFLPVNFVLVLLHSRITIKIIVVSNLITHSMHYNIDTHNFIELANTEFAESLDSFEIYVTSTSSPKSKGNCSEELYPDLGQIGLRA